MKTLFMEENNWYSSLSFSRLYKCTTFSFRYSMSIHQVSTRGRDFSESCSESSLLSTQRFYGQI